MESNFSLKDIIKSGDQIYNGSFAISGFSDQSCGSLFDLEVKVLEQRLVISEENVFEFNLINFLWHWHFALNYSTFSVNDV